MDEPNYHEAIQSLFDRFMVGNVSYGNRMWYGACPVHGGDNQTAFKLYEPGNQNCQYGSQPYWRCYTNDCHAKHGATLYGLAKGLWEASGDIPSSKQVSALVKSLNCYKPKNHNYDEINRLKQLGKYLDEPERKRLCGISELKKRLDTPSNYFILRGFKSEILEEFSIGDCYNESKEMYGRAVVPICDDDLDCYGVLGRSVFPECPLCGVYHKPGQCPLPNQRGRYPKWLNSTVKVHNHLFGIHKARTAAEKTRTIVLAEGVGDVLRLYQNGIKNIVSIFGAELHDNQVRLIEKMGVFNVIFAMDQDEAGIRGAAKAAAKLKYFNCIQLPIEAYKTKKDIGELTDEECGDAVEFITKVSSKYLIYS